MSIKDETTENKKELTPLMTQYFSVKKNYPECLLFFRLGDFYELFHEDAIVASKVLEITLTSRNKNDANPTPMCGVPHHSATNYINKLVNNGYKVAICEQLEDPASVKGIVKRDVVRIVTPGTQLDPQALDSKTNNYTAAIHQIAENQYAWAIAEYSTGLLVFENSTSLTQLISLFGGIQIAEFILNQSENADQIQIALKERFPNTLINRVADFYFVETFAHDILAQQFSISKSSNKNIFTLIHPNLNTANGAVAALVKYFCESQKTDRIPNLVKLEQWGNDGRFLLDASTVKALEILPIRTSAFSAGKDVSLLKWLDRTKTAMGGRLLKESIIRPFTDLTKIQNTLNQVETFTKNKDVLSQTQSELSKIYDLERLISRIELAMANARDVKALSESVLTSLSVLTELKLLQNSKTFSKENIEKLIHFCQTILKAIVDTPPHTIREAGLFNKGYNSDLDELIDLTTNGESWLAQFEARERDATKINSLKVKYNKVFGYYIEITKANLTNVPSHYIRKQTMVGGERYITEELKTYEEKILTSERKRQELEYSLFKELCLEFSSHAQVISHIAKLIAHVDLVTCFAQTALDHNLTKPNMNDSDILDITDGFHPTVASLNPDFIANSVLLNEEKRFLLITGPNMGGKSTTMRQTALIVLLAQCGSFVPAKKATIGLVDRIFTRIGANDNITEGASTFMVEMSEMSSIIRNATSKSLLLLDEIGRGTSTFDGLSIAWALANDIIHRVRARTLMSTHYQELTDLHNHSDSVVNARMAVTVIEKNHKQHVKFLYKLETGASEKSYGILVARLAGLPEHILQDAEAALQKLEAHQLELQDSPTIQLDLFGKPKHDSIV